MISEGIMTKRVLHIAILIFVLLAELSLFTGCGKDAEYAPRINHLDSKIEYDGVRDVSLVTTTVGFVNEDEKFSVKSLIYRVYYMKRDGSETEIKDGSYSQKITSGESVVIEVVDEVDGDVISVDVEITGFNLKKHTKWWIWVAVIIFVVFFLKGLFD